MRLGAVWEGEATDYPELSARPLSPIQPVQPVQSGSDSAASTVALLPVVFFCTHRGFAELGTRGAADGSQNLTMGGGIHGTVELTVAPELSYRHGSRLEISWSPAAIPRSQLEQRNGA